MIEIRPAIASDFDEVCGSRNHVTVRAFTVTRNGEPVAIAGITLERGQFVAFSDIKEGVTAPKMTIWKTARKLAELIKGLNLPAISTTSNGKFLESMGFQYRGESEDKQIYIIG